MFKKIFYVFLWTLLLVNMFWVSKDLFTSVSFIECIILVLENQHTYKDTFLFSLLIFMSINVTAIMIFCIYRIVWNLLQALGIISVSNKPKIKQMSMYINKDGYIDKSYFITIDDEKIPVKVYQSPDQKVEVQANE